MHGTLWVAPKAWVIYTWLWHANVVAKVIQKLPSVSFHCQSVMTHELFVNRRTVWCLRSKSGLWRRKKKEKSEQKYIVWASGLLLTAKNVWKKPQLNLEPGDPCHRSVEHLAFGRGLHTADAELELAVPTRRGQRLERLLELTCRQAAHGGPRALATLF